jgi:hypothetical protein
LLAFLVLSLIVNNSNWSLKKDKKTQKDKKDKKTQKDKKDKKT